MKKASKILTLILVFALLASVFSGCAMFGRDSAKYRAMVAVNVGSQEITVGKILDSFNNYYNMYYQYIGQGITTESLLQMAMQSLVTQAMKVDAYVSNNSPAADNTDLKGICKNAEYLSKEEIEYAIRYAKYITFNTFDSSVETQLTVDRTLSEEKAADTSRDFTEYDDLEGRSYSEFTYRNRVFDKETKEYLDKYYADVKIEMTLDVNEYVYNTEAAAAAKLKNLNDRLAEGDKQIEFSDYVEAQEKVVKQYERSIKSNYRMTMDEFMKNQLADIVSSIIASKYDYSVNKVIDTTDLNNTLTQLKSNLDLNRAAQATGFELNSNFVSFIESLSASTYIYNVPTEFARKSNGDEQSGYIFVKNILIPFNDQQKTTLSNLAGDLGGDTTHETYIKERTKVAAEVIADDFLVPDEEKDGEYKKVYNIFAKDSDGNLIINPEGALGKLFLADGTVAGDTIEDKTNTVIENMKRFNTDTAQHTAAYDYVVRVGDVPSDYTHSWVTEFVDAANEVAKKGVGSYALAISTYGVHIVYYSADVKAYEFDFSAENKKFLDSSTSEYKLFTAYFSEQSSRLLSENVEALQKSYVESKITTTKYFDKFLKDNKFEFDLIKFLSEED